MNANNKAAQFPLENREPKRLTLLYFVVQQRNDKTHLRDQSEQSNGATLVPNSLFTQKQKSI